MISTLKSRYGNKSKPKFVVGVNIDTQRMYDVSKGEQAKFVTHAPTKRPGKKGEAREKDDEPTRPAPRAGASNAVINKFKTIKVSQDD